MTAYEVVTTGEASCERVAAALVAVLPPPVCFALEGPLGAGKTTFVRGLVRALGCDTRVKSPTFALAHTYPSTPPVHHLDLYRLEGEDAAIALGLDEMLHDDEAYACAEWANLAPGLFTMPRRLRLVFSEEATDARPLRLEPGEGLTLDDALLARLRAAAAG